MTVVVETSDGVVFRLDPQTVQKIGTLQNLVDAEEVWEGQGTQNRQKEEGRTAIIRVPQVCSTTLRACLSAFQSNVVFKSDESDRSASRFSPLEPKEWMRLARELDYLDCQETLGALLEHITDFVLNSPDIQSVLEALEIEDDLDLQQKESLEKEYGWLLSK